MPKIIYLSIAVILVLSFSIHALDFNHAHYHGTLEEGLEVMMHTNKEEWLFLLLLAFISFGAMSFGTEEKRIFSSSSSNRFAFDSISVFEPVRRALRRGILHPKICG